MDAAEVIARRFARQRLTGEPFAAPAAAVRSLVAVQAQDLPGARWSLGQRLAGATDASVAAAFDAGDLLRTHLLRPTWHAVTPDDIRWLLDLTAPRVHGVNGTMHRKLGIDASVAARSQALFAGALRDGAVRTRAELAALLERNGIAASGQRLAYIVMRAELDGLLCSGPARGAHQTYALLEERAPAARRLPRDEALAELAGRFFAGHGPATLRDFATWSGLTRADAERGRAAEAGLARTEANGEVVWLAADDPAPAPLGGRAFLVPEFDEAYLTYKSLNLRDLPWTRDAATRPDAFSRPIVVDGHRAGTGRRTLGGGRVALEAALFAALAPAQERALHGAAARYAAFMERPADLVAV